MTDETASSTEGNAAEGLTGAAALIAAETADTGQTTVEAASAPDKLVTDAARAEWLKTLPDDATRTLAETKGWASPADVLKSYSNLEKLVGGDKIPAPKGPDDAEGYERLYKALGKPDTPDDYKLPVPDGQDGAFAKAIAPIFHKAGIGAQQAQVLATEWNAMQTAAKAQADKAFDVKAGQDVAELKTEWGDKFNAEFEMTRRAAKQFGLDGQALGKIERALGTKQMLTFLNKVGAGLAEDSFEGGNGGGGGTVFKLSPDAARARIEALKADRGWQERWAKGGADEKAEWNRLHALSTPS